MGSRGGGRTAAAVVLTVAAFLLAGCSDDGSDDTPNKAAAKDKGTTAPSEPAAPAPSPSDEDTGKKVPESELSPATGTFTEKEKEYLVGRVPEGMEPAAILEAGKEACSKIEQAAASDEKFATEAIRSGEISNAEDAVEHLCPKYKNLL